MTALRSRFWHNWNNCWGKTMTLEELKQLDGEDAFSPIDLVFAEFLLRRARSESPELFCAAALASYCVRAGNSCCDLNLYAGRRFPDPSDPEPGGEEPRVLLPGLDEWLSALRALPGAVIEHYPETVHPTAPLVLDRAHRLYLNRYFLYELSLADAIRRRCAAEQTPPDLAPGRLVALSPYFRKAAAEPDIDFQQSAVFLACSGNFSIITGGPGTGKTTVAAALLALELERNPGLEIALCAPTGKAQARLRDSVTQGIAGLACAPEIRERLSTIPCGTIHSLLSPLPGTTQFRHNEKNPLRADLIVVDEASMVSLPLMAKLLRAVRPEAKIVLLGDKDQLASVDAGAVLADLCACGSRNVMRECAAEAFQRQTSWTFPVVSDSLPLSGCIAELVKNHRSANAPNISSISAAIRNIASPEDLQSITARVAECDTPDFHTRKLPRGGFGGALFQRISEPCIRFPGEETLHAFRELRGLADRGGEAAMRSAFELIGRFRILCALRNGPYGTLAVNAALRAHLRMSEPFAAGLPLMIVRNHPETGLYNGDIGLVWRSDSGVLRVYFPDSHTPGVFRSFLPVELPEHEAVFAMTVHKSQGSGFQNVLIILPDHDTPVLTRELLYTALTRAEERVELWADRAVIAMSLERLTIRQSGLADRLRHPL